jgi:hypothetical protein
MRTQILQQTTLTPGIALKYGDRAERSGSWWCHGIVVGQRGY